MVSLSQTDNQANYREKSMKEIKEESVWCCVGLFGSLSKFILCISPPTDLEMPTEPTHIQPQEHPGDGIEFCDKDT